MRTLTVNWSLDPVAGGGTAERTIQISRAFIRAGTACTVLTVDVTPAQAGVLAQEGIDVIGLPCLSRRFYIPEASYRRIKMIVSRNDIVHLMGHWTYINAVVHLAARHLKKPYVVCPAGSLPIYGRSRQIKRLYNTCVGRRIVSQASGHVAIAASEIVQFQDYGVGAHRVSTIPNGVNVRDLSAGDRDAFRQKYSLGNSPFILFMGRLNHIKGPDLLLQAFAGAKNDLPGYRFVLAGPDEGMLTKLRSLARELRVADRVHFLGYLGGADKSGAYCAADLTVIPSRHEAMSIVVLEAGATGSAVLMTDQCGFDEVARVGGGMVVPASVSGLQDGLVRLLRDPERLKQMGAKLKEHVSENFTWDSVGSKYLSLFQDILRRDMTRASVPGAVGKGHCGRWA